VCVNPDFTPNFMSTGPSPRGLVSADFNGDGIPDLAFTNSDDKNSGNAGSVTVYLGHGSGGVGDGTFVWTQQIPVVVEPYGLIAADMDGDGKLDLITADNGSNTVSILLGHGDGSFDAPVSFYAGGLPTAVAAGDFNRDGINDLAVVDNSAVAVLIGQTSRPGALSFQTPRLINAVASSPAILAADLNHDGIIDLAFTAYVPATYGYGVDVWAGTGNGSFTLQATLGTIGTPSDVRLADLDADGNPDLVLAGAGGVEVMHGLQPLVPGDPLFAPSIQYRIAPAQTAAVGDFNGDGVLDIAAPGPQQLVLLIGGKDSTGKATGTFSPKLTTLSPTAAFGMLSADFNGDGSPDLALGHYSTNQLEIDLHVCRDGPHLPPPAPITGWGSNGIPVCIASGSQQAPAVLGLSDQGGIIAWQDGRSGTNFDIYAQRLDHSGHPMWPANGVPVCAAGGDQVAPAITGDGADGAFIAWTDARANGVFLTHVDGNGSVVPGWPTDGLGLIGSRMSQPKMVPDGFGGVLILTFGICCTDQDPLLTLFHLRANGSFFPGTPSGGLVVAAGAGSYAYEAYVNDPHMISNALGGAHVAWTWAEGSCDPRCVSVDEGGFAEINGLEGFMFGPARLTSDHAVPGLASDGFGGALQLVIRTGILIGQRISQAGVPIWTGAISGSSPKLLPIGAPDGNGGALVTWIDQRSGGSDLYGVHIDGSGTLVPGWIPEGSPIAVGTSAARAQIASDGHGGAFLAWDDVRSGDRDVYATFLDPSGAQAPGWTVNGTPVCVATGDQISVSMDAVPGGGAVMAWQDGRSDGGDIYAQRMSGDVATPIALSLVSSGLVDGHVYLVWYGGGASGQLTVSRSTNGSAWTAVGSPTPSGDGMLRFDDTDVTVGKRYGYRLVDGSGSAIAGSVAWITVPAGVPLALAEPWPNPATSNRVTVRTGFEIATPARIDWTDLSGRRVASQPVPDTAPGWHETTMDVPALPPGVYWLVLRQGSQVAKRRVVVLR
jgi:hypothetical protein